MDGILDSDEGEGRNRFEETSAIHMKVPENDWDRENTLLKNASIYIKNVWSDLSLKIHQDIGNLLNISYHSLLDSIVLNVPFYTVGSHGPQLCKPFFHVCECMCLADNCKLAITAFVVITKGERGEKKKKRSRTTLG